MARGDPDSFVSKFIKGCQPCRSSTKHEEEDMKDVYKWLILRHHMALVDAPGCSRGDFLWGRSPAGGHGNPLQYSCPENPMDRGAWQATVHRIAKSWTWVKQLNTHVWPLTSAWLIKTLLVLYFLFNSIGSKIMASGSITSWQIDGETVETVADFIFMGSKITEDGDCSHEILFLPRSKCTYSLEGKLWPS